MNPGLGNRELLENGVWWIDETGDIHSADSIDPSFDSLFVRHLGHVKVLVSDQLISMSWDVKLTPEASLEVALERLSAFKGHETFRLNYFYLGWATETVGSAEEAILRIRTVQSLRDVNGMPLTHVEMMDPGNLASSSPRIRESLRLWQQTDGHLSNATSDECSHLLPEVLIYRPSRRTGNLVFTWVGGRSFSTRVHGRAWAKRALRAESMSTVGSETSDYVDRISSAYEHVWRTGEPHLARVRTLLSPDGNSDPVWLDYYRLLLRYRLHDNRDALVCLSQPNSESFTRPPDAVP